MERGVEWKGEWNGKGVCLLCWCNMLFAKYHFDSFNIFLSI